MEYARSSWDGSGRKDPTEQYLSGAATALTSSTVSQSFASSIFLTTIG